MLDLLPKREADVIRMHHGFDDGISMTFTSIGARLGISRTRVQQIDASAKRRLHRMLHNHPLLQEE